MRRTVFVDSAAWIALLNARDNLHLPAQQVRQTLDAQEARLVTTEFVLLEVADALSAPNIRAITAATIRRLREPNAIHVVPVSESLFSRALVLFAERPDKEWGLTDCISFVVM